MAGRTRTTKKLAQRINLDYFKTLHGIPRWRRILSAVFTVAGLGWLGWHGLRGSPTPYNAGPIANAHHLIAHKCVACHASKTGFQQSVTDQACLGCHDGPIHHAEQTFSPACSDCHVEHKGVLRLAATSNQACAQCHGNLAAKDKNSPPRFAADISDFDSKHPEFAPLRTGQKDPGTIKFNHQVHLKKELRGPQGSIVQLKCDDCHRGAGFEEKWPFGEAEMTPASFTPGTNLSTMLPSRAYMEPVNYMKHCSSCHPLQFDRRIPDAAPHKDPKIVYDFALKKLTEYIAAHPDQIHTVDEPDKRLPSRPVPPIPRNSQEWIANHMADAQLLLWRKACKECHAMTYPNGPDALPVITKSAIPARWLPHSNFDHEAHQMVACNSCHAKVNKSQETSDVLIPGIQTCRQCHRSGSNFAEARCFECHTYHDWSKQKRINATYTVPSLVE